MQSRDIQIRNTVADDLSWIFDWFDQSIVYQERKGLPTWKNYDQGAIRRDIEKCNQYKVLIETQPAIVFSACYEDKVIWREREKGDAIYLHRIVVNPLFKGQRLFGEIVAWAKKQCEIKELQFIRLDTWAANPAMVAYYQSFGFKIIEHYTTPDTPELPIHNRNLALTLLELPLID